MHRSRNWSFHAPLQRSNEFNRAKLECGDAKKAVIAAHAQVVTQMLDVKVAEEAEKSAPKAAEIKQTSQLELFDTST
jgi:hypothetical protein